MTANEPIASRFDEAALMALNASMQGEVLHPGDDGYEPARHVWNGMIDRRPAGIARCRSAADVQAAVAFAREHQVLVAVRGGGHSVAGNAVCDDGLVIDLSHLKGIHVDPVAQTVRAEGGVTWGELDRETQAFGLATTGGQVTTTGIAGLTLGGGFGWLMRLHGLACDNLLSADIMTADGQFLTASATEHADLFWGLRGGGGNFGVVTSFEYRLHVVGPMVVAGVLVHSLSTARDLFRFYRDVSPMAPDALSCMAVLGTSPEGIPAAYLIPACIESSPKSEAALRSLRAFGSPMADLVEPMPYLTLQAMFDAGFPAGRRNYWKSGFLRGLDDAAIEMLVEHIASVPSPHSSILIEQYGGAVSRIEPGATAFPERAAPYNLVIMAAWDDPLQDEVNVSWAKDLWAAIRPYALDRAYVNYLGDASDEGTERVRSAYGAATYDRLVALKRTYDSTNLFRVNQNIVPA